MFGVGYQEMLLIGLAALLLFGPGKMPEMMSQAGKWYKQFRDVTAELSGEFNKTVAEAKGELDAMGVDLGPMQKQVNSISQSVQKDLGGGAKTTTTGRKTTTSTGGKKAGTTGSKSKTSSTSTSKTTSNRTSSAAKKTNTTSTTASKTKTNMTAGKPVVVASKDDPFAGVSLFEQTERKPKRRARSATPSAFTDLTPRDDSPVEEPVAAAVADSAPITIDPNDPVARARQRRMKAGYTQATA